MNDLIETKKNQTLVGKGNLEGSVLQGVWMAVSGGGHDWVISWGKKENVTQLHGITDYYCRINQEN